MQPSSPIPILSHTTSTDQEEANMLDYTSSQSASTDHIWLPWLYVLADEPDDILCTDILFILQKVNGSQGVTAKRYVMIYACFPIPEKEKNLWSKLEQFPLFRKKKKNTFKHLKTSYQKLQDDTNSCLNRSTSMQVHVFSRRYGNPFRWSIVVSQWSSIRTS